MLMLLSLAMSAGQVPAFRAGVDLVNAVSRRRERPGRPHDHAALYRRRRHAELALAQRADGSAEGLGRDGDAIGELEHQSASTKNEQRMVLQQIAEVTGGRAFFPYAVKQLDEVYATVVAEIRAQYTIGYLSTNEKTDGSWRKVEIRLASKDTSKSSTSLLMRFMRTCSLPGPSGK